jgi:hypothetical protein
MPPSFDESVKLFAPAPEVRQWIEQQIIAVDGQLHNPEHGHLALADLAVMWAAEGFNKAMRRVIGQAEQVTFRTSGWSRWRQEEQMRGWFGRVPEYLITLDASYCAECSDADWCALVEHELYHIAQELDEFGSPAFTKDGMPKLRIRGHDVEEFVGVVRRYGAGHSESQVARLVAAANAVPEMGRARIAGACGTCLLRAA